MIAVRLHSRAGLASLDRGLGSRLPHVNSPALASALAAAGLHALDFFADPCASVRRVDDSPLVSVAGGVIVADISSSDRAR